MNKLLFILIIWTILILTTGVKSDTGSAYPYILNQTILKHGVVDINLQDIDNDLKDEYLVIVEQKDVTSAIRLYDDNYHTIYFQKNFDTQVLNCSAINWGRSGIADILIIEKSKTSLNFLLVDCETGNDTLAFFPVIPELKSDDLDIRAPAFYDLDGDHYPEIFLSVNTSFNPWIRAVIAIDLRRKKILWQFNLAPHAKTPVVVTDSKLDHPLLMVPTQSPDNNYKIGTMDDYHSYVIFLDINSGRPRKIDESGEWPSFTDMGIINTREKQYIYTYTAGQNVNQRKTGQLMIWDIETLQIIKCLKGFYPDESVIIGDVDNDGNEDIIRSGKDNRVTIYNHELQIIKNFILPGNIYRVLEIIDIERDGYLELLVLKNQTDFSILNNQGQELAVLKNKYGRISAVNKGLSVYKNISVLNFANQTFEEFELDANYVLVNNDRQNLIIGIIVGLIVPLFLFVAIRLYKRKNYILMNDKSILNSLSSAVLISDLKGKVKFANHGMERMLKLNEASIKFLSFKDICNRIGVSIDVDTFLNSKRKQVQEYEVRPQAFNQQSKYLIRIRSMISDNKLFALLLIAEDISLSMGYQKSVEWSGMAQRMVHEIKNPLTTVKLTLQRLKMEYENENKYEKYDEYVESILEEVSRLRNVAENFLKLFKTDHPAFKPVNLTELIHDIINPYQIAQAGTFKISLKDDIESLTITADRYQIEIMIKNIVDNAIRAILSKGEINIHLYETEKPVNEKFIKFAVIVVEDNGCGIEESRVKKIFEPYVSGNDDGTGLGLAIVKKIVEAHHGDIYINSKPKIGTAVTIELPFKQIVIPEQGLKWNESSS